MPLRGERGARRDPAAVWEALHEQATRAAGTTVLNGLSAHGEFALCVRLPGVTPYWQPDGWFLLSRDCASWARVTAGHTYRYGARDLLGEAETAVAWWHAEDCPRLFDFGVTVAPGRQEIWLREPAHIVGRLAEPALPPEDGG